MNERNKNKKNPTFIIDDPPDPPDGYITKDLCKAYRQTMITEISGLKDDIKEIKDDVGKVDRRIWWILGSVVVFGVISIAIALFG